MSEIFEPLMDDAPAVVLQSKATRIAHPERVASAAYRPDIDGLRAVAVLAVVAFHAAPGRMAGGFIGVDIFFVISGYLISSIILKGLEKDNFSFAHFYDRRIKRIFPALFLVLVASFVAGWFLLLADQYQLLGKHVAAGAAFSSNFALWSESGYFDNEAESKILLHLWSLGIEEQFYLLWPVTLWWAWKRKVSLPALLAVVGAVSFAASLILLARDPAAAFYLPFGRAWELLAGAGLAYVALGSHPGISRLADDPRLANAQSLAGALLVGLGFLAIDRSSAFPGWWALLPVLGAVLLISGGPKAWVNRVLLSNRPMVWFGLISFPLYLWHWPILSFLRILEGEEVAQKTRLVAVLASILLAWLSYRFVEKPIRHGAWKRVGSFSLVALMAAIGLVGVVCYAKGGFENRQGTLPKVVNAGDTGHYQFFSYIDKNFSKCMPLDIRQAAGEWNGFVRCFQSKPGLATDVAIIGDSHAEHLFPGLAERLPDSNVVYYGKGGLPFLRNREFDRIFAHVLADKGVKVVILAASWNEKLATYPAGRVRLELGETVAKLTQAGKKVYLTEDLPMFSFIPSRCKYSGRLGLENKCSEPDRHPDPGYLREFENLQAGNDQLGIIRTHAFNCRGGSCSMAQGGVLQYRDREHLNLQGSRSLAALIVGQMK